MLVSLSSLQAEPGWCLIRLLLWLLAKTQHTSSVTSVYSDVTFSMTHTSALCCMKMLAHHLATSEMEEQVLSLGGTICLIYLATECLLLIFFTVGSCDEFGELKSDCQSWLFTASKTEKKNHQEFLVNCSKILSITPRELCLLETVSDFGSSRKGNHLFY